MGQEGLTQGGQAGNEAVRKTETHSPEPECSQGDPITESVDPQQERSPQVNITTSGSKANIVLAACTVILVILNIAQFYSTSRTTTESLQYTKEGLELTQRSLEWAQRAYLTIVDCTSSEYSGQSGSISKRRFVVSI